MGDISRSCFCFRLECSFQKWSEGRSLKNPFAGISAEINSKRQIHFYFWQTHFYFLNKSKGRLERYKNRHEAGKNVPGSWDRALSIDDVKWCIGRKSKLDENNSGRFGRYKNRNEARKNVLRSWDRDLSIGEVKWSIRRKSKWCKNQKWERKWSFGTP